MAEETTMQDFGDMLRDQRKRAQKSMGDLARHLGVSVTYVSDVELGRRAPFAPERIISTGAYLGVDPAPLLAAAAKMKGAIELIAANASLRQLAVGAGLMRHWTELSDEQLAEIEKVLDRTSVKGEG